MGTPEENKALVRRFLDALGSGDVATAASCFDPERYYSHAHRAGSAGTDRLHRELAGGDDG